MGERSGIPSLGKYSEPTGFVLIINIAPRQWRAWYFKKDLLIIGYCTQVDGACSFGKMKNNHFVVLHVWRLIRFDVWRQNQYAKKIYKARSANLETSLLFYPQKALQNFQNQNPKIILRVEAKRTQSIWPALSILSELYKSAQTWFNVESTICPANTLS